MTAMAAPSPRGTPSLVDLDGQPDASPYDFLFDPGFLDFSGPFFADLQPDMTANEELSGPAVSSNNPHLAHLAIAPLDYDMLFDESPPSIDPSRTVQHHSAFSDASSSPGPQAAGTHLASVQSPVPQVQYVEDVSARDSTHSPPGDLILTPSSTYSHLGYGHNLGAGDPSDDNISPASSQQMDTDIRYPGYDSVVMQQAALFGGIQPPPLPPSFAGRFRPGRPQASNTVGSAQWGMIVADPSAINYNPGYSGQPDVPHNNSVNAWTDQGWNTTRALPTASQSDNVQTPNFNNATFDANSAHRNSYPEAAVTQSFPGPGYSFHEGPNRATNHQLTIQRGSMSFDPTLTINPSYTHNLGFAQVPMPLPGDVDTPMSNYAPFEGQGHNISANPNLNRSVPVVPSQRGRLLSHLPQRGAQHVFPSHIVRQRPGPYPGATRPLPNLARAPVNSVAPESPPLTQTGNGRGGRKKGKPLAAENREQSGQCRKDGACWRCAIQRDPCKPGDPCPRCYQKTEKGQILAYPCDRSKLYDFVHDFLPPSMTVMHQRQSILDTVHDQVIEWDSSNPIQVQLTSGYGRTFVWTLHEFRPRTTDLLGQFQYIQNRLTGRSERIHKYSPPFGVMKLDSSDERHVEEYLKDLMEWEHMHNLGWKFYDEERLADPDEFQATLLTTMCVLYKDTVPDPDETSGPKYDLRKILDKILRMVIITYIMGHTLTIPDECIEQVIEQMRFTSPQRPQRFQKHTSPRLANRQLKFYFAVLRAQLYDDVLRQLQQVFRNSRLRDDYWLFSFCAIIGLGMVLEEVQRTIWIQCDAKIVKHEAEYHPAITEAQNACQRIDDRYGLLIKLFQAKYKDRKWNGNEGSFGPSTPTFTSHAQVTFLGHVKYILEVGRDHLESRKDIACSQETTDQYTSRLVSRFLLPFLEMQGVKRS